MTTTVITPTPNDMPSAQAQDNGSDADGFPADTPLAEMNVQQQANYWKHQARKHEGRAKARGDYDDLKKKAEELDKKLDAEKSEHDKALETARKEGFEQAVAQANEKAASAMLRAALSARKVKDSEIEDILSFTNTSALVAGGDIDADKILSYADRLAGKPDDKPSTTQYPDMGQGQRGDAPRTSAREMAKAIGKARGYTKD